MRGHFLARQSESWRRCDKGTGECVKLSGEMSMAEAVFL
jgi:hypothetical protein